MAAVGVAVEQLDARLGADHQRIVHRAAGEHRAHRDRSVGQALGGSDEIGNHADQIGAEAGDDLVEDQQDAVPRRDLAQPLEIASGRQQHAGRSRHRLDDHRRDRLGAMQLHEPLEIVRQLGTMLGQIGREGVAGEIVRVAQMIAARQHREGAAIVDQPAHRDAAEADPVIAALASDQAGARSLADRALVGERDLERGIDRLRPRSGEEHPIEAARRDLRQSLGEGEGDRMAHLEGRRIIHGGKLRRDRIGDLRAAVPGIDAPQARRAIKYASAVVTGIIHALRRSEQARRLLELAIGGERHPIGIEMRPVRSCRPVHRHALVSAHAAKL